MASGCESAGLRVNAVAGDVVAFLVADEEEFAGGVDVGVAGVVA